MGQESITSAVSGILRKNPHVCDCLHFSNYSRLAVLMKPAVERRTARKVSKEAIKTAIRRFAQAHAGANFYGNAVSVLRGGRLSLRNNISVLALYPGMHAIGKIPEIEKIIDRRKGEILHVVAGINCIVMILDDSNFSKAERIMRKDVLSERTGLGAITITTSLKITNTPGVIAHITTLLAQNGINIEEVSSCYTDTILILDKREAIRAYNLLEEAAAPGNEIGSARRKKDSYGPLFRIE